MAFEKKTWKDRLSEFPSRRLLKVISRSADGNELVVDTNRYEGTVSQDGDAFSGENMNDLEQRIADEFAEINSNLSDLRSSLQVVQGTEITVRQVPGTEAASNAHSSTGVLAIEYKLPAGYVPIMAIPYTPTWFAQVSLQEITDTKIRITVFNGYYTVQDIIAGAHVLVVKNNL